MPLPLLLWPPECEPLLPTLPLLWLPELEPLLLPTLPLLLPLLRPKLPLPLVLLRLLLLGEVAAGGLLWLLLWPPEKPPLGRLLLPLWVALPLGRLLLPLPLRNPPPLCPALPVCEPPML